MLSEISQRKRNTIGFHLYVESKEQNKQTKLKQTHKHTANQWLPEGRRVGDWVRG